MEKSYLRAKFFDESMAQICSKGVEKAFWIPGFKKHTSDLCIYKIYKCVIFILAINFF
jgi:hypothetical protein